MRQADFLLRHAAVLAACRSFRARRCRFKCTFAGGPRIKSTALRCQEDKR